jgi:acetyl esterase/lipase
MRTFLLALTLASACLAADRTPEHFNIPLWDDGKVPLAAGNGPLDKPFLTVFLPPEGKRNGSSVVVAPGGSNIMLMYGVEGVEIAERYNDWGAAAFVLTYRMSPRYNYEARSLDGKRAIQIVRARAKEWGPGSEEDRDGGFLRRFGDHASDGTVVGSRRPECDGPDRARQFAS